MNNTPTPPKPHQHVRFFHIYFSETGTEAYLISCRIVSNSKTRTKYMTSHMFPVLPQTLVFPKASSLLFSTLFWNNVPLAEVSLHRHVFPAFIPFFFPLLNPSQHCTHHSAIYIIFTNIMTKIQFK